MENKLISGCRNKELLKIPYTPLMLSKQIINATSKILCNYYFKIFIVYHYEMYNAWKLMKRNTKKS